MGTGTVGRVNGLGCSGSSCNESRPNNFHAKFIHSDIPKEADLIADVCWIKASCIVISHGLQWTLQCQTHVFMLVTGKYIINIWQTSTPGGKPMKQREASMTQKGQICTRILQHRLIYGSRTTRISYGPILSRLPLHVWNIEYIAKRFSMQYPLGEFWMCYPVETDECPVNFPR